MPGFWDEFTPRERPSGKYTAMRDLVKLGDPFIVSEVIDDEQNTYNGQPSPRFLLKGKLQGGMDDMLVSVKKGYSRDETIRAMAEYLDSADDQTVTVKFVRTGASAYIDIVSA